MKVIFTGPDCDGDAQLEWEYAGRTCIGAYFASTSIIALNFLLPESTVLLTYRILDTDSLLHSTALPAMLLRWRPRSEGVTDKCVVLFSVVVGSACGHDS